MKKTTQKWIAVLLACTMLFTAMIVPASAKNAVQDVESPEASTTDKLLWNGINAVVTGLLRTMCFLFPNPRWESYSEYSPEKVGILPGRDTFRTEPDDDAEWRLGYGRESLIPKDFEAGKYYMGRKLNIVSFQGDAKATEVLDDQFCRAVAIDDGTSDGAVAIAVIDGIGVTSTEIREIRRQVKAKLGEDAFASINVSATHCHSVIDTQGVSSSFLLHLFAAPICNILNVELPGTKDERNFKNILVSQSVKAICNAYETMTAGDMYYSTLDGSEYIYDKKDPIVPECSNIACLRFQPKDESVNGTYMINMTAHPTSFSYKNTTVSSDYPYYMDMEFNANGYNFILLTGAIGQIGRDTGSIEVPEDNTDPYYTVKAYGKTLADFILANADKDTETLPPVINAVHKDFNITCTNYLLVLAVKCRLVNNQAFRVGLSPNSCVLPTEVGYIELGNRVGFGLYPAELYPEVYWGHAFDGDIAWDGTDWQYNGENSMSHMNRDGVDMYPICFANDYVGYVVPDNDFAFMAHEPDELLSTGKYAASTIIQAFQSLMEQIEKA